MKSFLILLVLALLSPALSPPVDSWAQTGREEALGSAEAPILNDNLDAARSRAVRSAQVNVIRNLLRERIDGEWFVLFDRELRRRILSRIGRYISAYRVVRQDTSLDRTRYFAEVAAQVDESRLNQDLRELGLPVKGDPLQPVHVLYGRDDPVMRYAIARETIREQLAKRLAKLNFRIVAMKGYSKAEADLLPLATPDHSARAKLLGRIHSRAALYLRFVGPSSDIKAAPPEGMLLIQAWMYQTDNSTMLGEFSHQAPLNFNLERLSTERVQRISSALVTPLLTQLQPGALRPFVESAVARRLKLRVLGLLSYQDQEEFESAFLGRNSRFRGFSLYRFDRDTVTYDGEFTGSRRRLVGSLQGTQMGAFKIREVFWFNETLELEVQRTEWANQVELRPFPEYGRRPDQARVIEKYFSENPEGLLEDPQFTEVEDNGWFDRANQLEFDTTVYGFVDSRGDLDFYVGEFLDPGEELEVVWRQIDRTNLSPSIRIYSSERKLMRTVQSTGARTFRYTLPPGEARLFLEVGDRFGYVRGDAGGYLSYHYMLSVRRISRQNELAGPSR